MKILSSFLAFLAFAGISSAGLITPAGITLESGSQFYLAAYIIDDSGLSGLADEANYTTITHAAVLPNNAWTTDAPGGAVDYFGLDRTLAPLPVFILPLGGDFFLTDLVFWGYHFDAANGNESKEFLVEFSNDNGTTYPASVVVSSTAIAQGAATTLPFGGSFLTNQVRLTVNDNWFGSAGGGDRAGLGEVKFIGTPNRDPFLEAPTIVNLELNGGVQTFTIDVSNGGQDEDLVFDLVEMSGVDGAKFTVVSAPTSLTPQAGGQIQLSFDPGGVAGVISASILIETNDPVENESLILLSGVIADPIISVSPASIRIGPLPSNSGAQMLSVTVSNAGFAQNLTLDPAPAIVGPDSGHFSTTAPSASILPGNMSDIDIVFDPLGKDGIFRATLQISSNSVGAPVVEVPILVIIDIEDPLVAWWPLDVDGTDASGNGHDGVAMGSPVLATGANANTGGSLDFDGSTTRFDVAYSPDVNPLSFTVTLWANADSTATGFRSPITSRDDFQGSETHGFIIYNNSVGNWDFWTGDGNPGWDELAGASVVTGTWTHIAIVYDFLTNTKTLYIDGVESAVDNASPTPQYSPNGSTVEQEALHIGAGQDDGNNFWFDGRIDDIGLFRDVLTVDEINSIKDNGVASVASRIPPFQILSINRLANGNVELTFESTLDTIYDIERSTDLEEWLPGFSGIGANGVTTVIDDDPLTDTEVFYRIINTGEQD